MLFSLAKLPIAYYIPYIVYMTTGRYIGHVVRETDDKIVIFGDRNDRYDIPKSEIQTTGRNVLIGGKITFCYI
jgi:hypothetical protein